MEHEQKILFRRAYSAYIPEYINAMGIAVCYHMKQTLRTLLEYLLIYDGPEEVSRRNALLSLKVLISVAWPRIPYHWEEIMKNILICIYEVEEEDISIEVKSLLLNEARNCLLYMKKACPEKFEVFLKSAPTDSTLPVIDMIKSLDKYE
ncbi:TELO2-interacting protein 2-like isoform X2 [Centruroides sculpturatus]|uniref:TELO2-interacting protein 2-like isoform X2 n=1 Tax=Centruroides sculpturatus TaxID=218467 RepID=UPI000C6D3AB0|nr:TELO2-interacting protein 2-like isoform X2 [Centruroides sculpturatus]